MTKNKSPDDDVLNVKSVGKAFDVLECFRQTSLSESELSLMDIARLTGFDKSTTQRFVHSLLMAGYLSKNESNRRYSLSLKVLDLAYHFLSNNSFVELANPYLIELCRVTECRVSLSLIDDIDMVYAIRHQVRPDYYSSSLLGKRLPIYCSSGGRSVLAHLSEEQRRDILSRSTLQAFTNKTQINVQDILYEVELAKEKGYARTVEQVMYGEVGLGAAILDRNGVPVAAIHLIGNLAEWEPDAFEARFASTLLETVQRISRR